MFKPSFGIMQGRLLPDRYGAIQSFPGGRWTDEFNLAANLGLSHIEWIYEDRNRSENPLASTERVDEILRVIELSGVVVQAICADYFMEHPYLKALRRDRVELADHLLWLVEQAHAIGADYIDLPFVDNSSIADSGHFDRVVEFVMPASQRASELNLTIALETDLAPSDFRNLLSLLPQPAVAANYDSGNSAGIGYNFKEEMAAYGGLVKTVHIKDKEKGGPTVPLGSGAVDFLELFSTLHNLNYAGPIVLQGARKAGSEEATICEYKEFVERYVSRAVNG